MKRAQSCFLALFLLVLLIPSLVRGQAWTGIIDSPRAIDWTQAGIPGGVPSGSWSQCVTPACNTVVSASSSATAAQINAALASAPANSYVSLAAGTYNLSSGINFGSANNVALRGQGANQTFLVFSGSTSCHGLNASICMVGSGSSTGYANAEDNVCDWTSGYAPGTTTITLANCGSTTPARGSLSNLKVGSLLILDQVDMAADNGQIWTCETQNVCANTTPGGYERMDGPSVNGVSYRGQEQGVIVTSCGTSTPGASCTSGTVTISPGIYMPNWTSTLSPQAYYASSYRSMDGVENLSMDNTHGGTYGIMVFNGIKCWVSGVRSLYGQRDHVMFYQTSHNIIRDSYFYQNTSHASVSYALEMNNTFDALVENNICHQVTDSCPNNNGPSVGNVAGYNFGINMIFTATTGWFQASFYQHAMGDNFYLFEGNVGTGYNADSVHGTHAFNTLFRNYLSGQNQTLCNATACYLQTVPVSLTAGARYFNFVGNVLGTSGYHNNYSCYASTSTCANSNTSIWNLGYTAENMGQPNATLSHFCTTPSCSTLSDYDPQVWNYLLRWGNYDTVNAAVQWNSSEVPSTVSPYGNAVPSSQSLPPSFYLSSKPSWFGSVVWPPIGPDVSGGTISAVAGHANMIPAMVCYSSVMGGPADGTGGALSFNAASCYGSQVGAGPTPPAPPTNLSAVVQ